MVKLFIQNNNLVLQKNNGIARSLITQVDASGLELTGDKYFNSPLYIRLGRRPTTVFVFSRRIWRILAVRSVRSSAFRWLRSDIECIRLESDRYSDRYPARIDTDKGVQYA